MTYEKFKPDDIFFNRAKTHPQFDFFVYNSAIYINNHLNLSGAHVDVNVLVPDKSGWISLYEKNIDRKELANANGYIGLGTGVPNKNLIYPFIVYNGYKQTFKKFLKYPNVKSSTDTNFTQNYPAPNHGDVITSSYVMSASISRKLAAPVTLLIGPFNPPVTLNRTASALQTSALKYANLSKHFIFEPTGSKSSQLYSYNSAAGAFGTGANQSYLTRNMLNSNINFIFIPSVFYGSSVKRGSVSLKYYYTGSLIAELVDKNRNGELIQVSGTVSANDGKVAGVILYDEGIMMLTGSWDLETHNNIKYYYDGNNYIVKKSSWIYFGTTMNDGTASSDTLASASYNVSFLGTNYVNTMTMFCHAKKGHLNYSNNPTYMDLANSASIRNPAATGSYQYLEDPIPLKNVVSSSFHSASEAFQKTTYLSKVGIYDKNGNLIMVGNLAKPIRKDENRELTFKLKLDI